MPENFKLSTAAFVVEKVRDMVGLYWNPPARPRAVGRCVDEKSQGQALDRGQPVLPLRPGQAEHRPQDYYRPGTTSLFAALDIATGHVIGRGRPQPRHQEFLRFLAQMERPIPGDKEIHLVLDHDAPHKTPKVAAWFHKRPRYHLHLTPTSAGMIVF